MWIQQLSKAVQQIPAFQTTAFWIHKYKQWPAVLRDLGSLDEGKKALAKTTTRKEDYYCTSKVFTDNSLMLMEKKNPDSIKKKKTQHPDN